MQNEKIKKCPTCGMVNDIYTRSCKRCGRRLEQPAPTVMSIEQQHKVVKICPDCASVNDVNVKHCGKCGRTLFGAKGEFESQVVPSSEESLMVPINEPEVLQHLALKQLLPAEVHQPYPTIVKNPLRMGMRFRFFLILLIFLVILIPLLIFLPRKGNGGGSLKRTPGSSPTQTQVLHLPNGLGEGITASGQNIGINDGSFAPFDIGRNAQEMAFKQQAAIALTQGNAEAAMSLWYQALDVESNDAEALIYLEDQRVLISGEPYVTLIAGTSFTPPFPDHQYENALQGIYTAQHEFNQNHQAFRVRVLIANLGNSVETNNTPPVIQQIMQVATRDKTVVGVIGWLNSSITLNALSAFGKFNGTKIPIISPQASSDHLSGVSPYFFRVVAPNQVQAQAAAQFMKNILYVKNPVVFVDPNDQYSQNLAQDFESEFAAGGHLREVDFKTDSVKDFSSLVQSALKYNPDAFYFTSPSSVDAGNFQNALPTTGLYANIPAVGGDGGYAITQNGINRWFFTEYAYHGEGTATPIAARFAQEYTTNFDPGPHPQKPAGYYGYSLPDDHSILAYDATSVVLAALEMAYASGKTTLTPQILASTLPKITGANAFQGVSGQIAFDDNNNPINKAIVILSASKSGYRLYNVQGCFVKGCK